MPATLRLQNFDEVFNKTMTDKIIINDIDIFNTENKEMLDNMIMINYSDDNISIIPSCKCGQLKGEYYVGDKCNVCHTTVVNSLDDAISYLVWAKQPIGVQKFVSPIVMTMLMARYKITKPNIKLIEYIIIPGMKIDKKQQRNNMEDLEKLDYMLGKEGIAKGYNSFVANFLRIIEILEMEFMKKTKVFDSSFLDFMKRNINNIFSQYLPFPNRVVIATDSNELGLFIDKSLFTPLEVVRRLTGIDQRTRTDADKQRKVARSVIDMANFYEKYLNESVFKKPGLIRQQITAARSHFTARAVIVSIEGPHVHDELHIPWSIACSLLRPDILNCLDKRGYFYKQAVSLLIMHNRQYHPLLDEIFSEILAASGNGLKILFSRNPVLHRGSIQALRITKIKTNTRDNTFSMSDRIAPAYNADHDGKLIAIM